jgi:hypothetical protein
LNPGRPVEFPTGALLGAIGVGVEGSGLASLSGEYVKAGMFVLFIGAPTNAAGELAGAIEAGALDRGMDLLKEDEINALGVGVRVTLETAAAEDGGVGAGVGVK